MFPLERSQRILDLVILRVFEPDIIVNTGRFLEDEKDVSSKDRSDNLPFFLGYAPFARDQSTQTKVYQRDT